MTSPNTFRHHYVTLLKLGLPILVGQAGTIVVGFADNIMVGRYSTEALASASFVNNIFNVALFCCVGFTYGLTPLVGALFAEKRSQAIGSMVRTAMRVNSLYTLAMIVVMGILYFFIDRMGQPEELLPVIRPYYVLYWVGMLPVMLFNLMAQWSYGINNTRMPMWIILAANALNIFGNWLLIFGNLGCPEMGLTGAGISTLAARIASAIAILWAFFRLPAFKSYADGFRSCVRPSDGSLLWRTSLPVSLQMTFETGSFSMAAVMAGWLGTVSLAAFQIFLIVGMLGFCLYYSLGAAIAVRVAYATGLSDKHLMRRVAWAGYHLEMATMAVSCMVFVFAGRYLMGAFTDDPAVLALAVSLILPLVLYQAGDATQITFANALRGSSRVMPMLWIAFFSYVVIGIPATYLLAFPLGLGTFGIILSFSVSLFTAAALFLYYFLRATRQ